MWICVSASYRQVRSHITIIMQSTFASPYFTKVGKIEKVFDRTAKVIYNLFINIVIYPLAVSRSNCPELADTKGFLFVQKGDTNGKHRNFGRWSIFH